MERFKSVLNSLNKKTLTILLAIVATLSAMLFGGVNMLSQGKINLAKTDENIGTNTGDEYIQQLAAADVTITINPNGGTHQQNLLYDLGINSALYGGSGSISYNEDTGKFTLINSGSSGENWFRNTALLNKTNGKTYYYKTSGATFGSTNGQQQIEGWFLKGSGSGDWGTEGKLTSSSGSFTSSRTNTDYLRLDGNAPGTYTFSIMVSDTSGTTSSIVITKHKNTKYHLQQPTRTGYTFAGWTLSGDGSVSGNVYTWGSTSATLTANWTAINYTITPKANGGSGGSVSPNTYNISTNNQTAKLTLPTRAGYTLSSWTVSGHTGTIPTVSGTTLTIPANTYGNLTLTANWTITKAYLHKNWQRQTDDYVANSNITSIKFTKTKPTSYDNAVNVGAASSTYTGATYLDTVVAYISGTTITFYSPATIYAPQNCWRLFSNLTSSNCLTSLTSITFDNFDTSEVTNMSYMFYGCSKLTSLDVSNFVTNSVTDMSHMFESCSKLTTLIFFSESSSQSTLNHYNTLYGKADTFVIGIDPNGGTLTVDGRTLSSYTSYSVECAPGDSVSITITGTRSGYTLSGWTGNAASYMTSSNGVWTGTFSYDDLGLIDTLIAQWQGGESGGSDPVVSYKFNTSSVTDMSDMFYGCSSLTSLDLSNFNTEKVSYMSTMFDDCSGLTSLNISNFDMTSVTNCAMMFDNCTALKTLNTPKTNAIAGIFLGLSVRMYNTADSIGARLSNVYTELPITTGTSITLKTGYTITADCYNAIVTDTTGKWSDKDNIGRVRRVVLWDETGVAFPTVSKTYYTFVGWTDAVTGGNAVTSLDKPTAGKTIYAQWVVEKAYLYEGWKYQIREYANITSIAFTNTLPTSYDKTVKVGQESSTYTGSIIDSVVAYIKGTTVTIYSSMTIYAPKSCAELFRGFSSLTSLDLNGLNTDNVTNMSKMFYECNSLTSLTIPSTFSTDNVTDMNSMFYGCSGLTNLVFPNSFNTSNVTDMNSMFYECDSLASLNLSNFNTTNVTNMDMMFRYCSSLTSINLNSFNTSNVTNMSSMFIRCSRLTSLDLSKFVTNSVTTMGSMFSGCSSLTSLDVSNFVTNSVRVMSYMFHNCRSLTSLDISNFTIGSSTSVANMLDGMTSLKTFVAPKPTTSNQNPLQVALTLPSTNFVDTSLAIGSRVLTDTVSATDDGKTFKFGYTLTADANGGTLSTASGWTVASDKLTATKIVLFDETIGNWPTATKTGYTFNRWADAATGGNAVTSLDKPTANKTIYAQWTLEKAYFHKNWQSQTDDYVANSNITSILFTSTKPTSYDNAVNVGAVDGLSTIEDTNFKDNVVAYISGTTITFYSPITIYAPQDSSYLFSNSTSSNRLASLTRITFGNFDTSEVTNMSYMFADCSKLTSVNFPTNSSSQSTLNHYNTLYGDKGDHYNIYITGLDGGTLIVDGNTITSSTSYEFEYEAGQDPVLTITGTRSGYILSGFSCSALVSQTSNNGIWTVTLDWYLLYNHEDIGGLSPIWEVDESGGSDPAVSCNFNTSNVTDMQYMFQNCSSLTSLDVSNFVTNSVKNMGFMFYGCSKLTGLTFGSNFNTSSVTSMSSMFTDCRSLTSLDLSNFNTSSVTNMSYMFFNCRSLTSLTFGTNFNTSSVTNMWNMFSGCSSLTSLDVSGFNTSSVTDMHSMFDGCRSLTSLDVSGFNTSSVTDMRYMFYNCRSLTSLTFGTNFNTSSVTDMRYMFNACRSLTSLTFGTNFNTSSVTDMRYMFEFCSSLTSLDISNFTIGDSTTVTVGNMFYGCTALNTIKTPTSCAQEVAIPNGDWYEVNESNVALSGPYTTLSSSNTGKTIKLISGEFKAYLHKNWQSATSGTLANANITSIVFTNKKPADGTYTNTVYVGAVDALSTTSNTNFVGTVVAYINTTDKSITFYSPATIYAPQDSSHLFSNSTESLRLTALISITFGNFNTSEVTDGGGMFAFCNSLKITTYLENFDTSKLTTMNSMFQECHALTSLNLGGFNTSSLTQLQYTFTNCYALQDITFSSNFARYVTNMNYAFYGCSSLTSLDISNFSIGSSTNVTNMLIGMTSLKTFVAPNTLGKALTLPSTNFVDTSLAVGSRVLTDTVSATDDGKTFKFGYTLTADANGGALSIASGWTVASDKLTATKIVLFDETIGNWPTATKTGYTFNRWADAATGGNAVTSLDKPTANKTIYAQWTPIKYTISYYSTSTSTKYTTQSVDYNATYSLPTAPTKDGFTFAGWSTSADTTTDWTSGTQTCTGDKSWYAVWKKVWKFNDTSSSTVTQTVNYVLTAAASQSYAKTNPTREGYVFAGYATSNNTTINTNAGASSTSVTSTSATPTYYAVWSYTVTASYNGNGATGGSTSASSGTAYKNYDLSSTKSANIILATNGFTRNGYIFSKWAEGSESGTQYAEGTIRSLTENTTYYTIWTFDKAYLNENWQDKVKTSLATENITKIVFATGIDKKPTTYDKTVNVGAASATDPGFTFIDTVVAYIKGTTVTFYSPVTIYAQEGCWKLFSNLSALTSIDFGSFNTSEATLMQEMFSGCSSLTSIDLSGFNTNNVQTFDGMFSNCSSLQSIDLSSFNTDNVILMIEMFSGCNSLTSITFPNELNTSKVERFDGMFFGCSNLRSINISKFNTSNATSLMGMFLGCSSLTNLTFPNTFSTAKVTDMSYMFTGCSKISSLTFPNTFSTAKVTSMEMMFAFCSSLTSITFGSGFTNTDTTNMIYMFLGCNSLTSLEFPSTFSTANVTDMTGMFAGCSGLTSLDFSMFNTSKVTSMSLMFAGVTGPNGNVSQEFACMSNGIEYTDGLTWKEMYKACNGQDFAGTEAEAKAWFKEDQGGMFNLDDGRSVPMALTTLNISNFDMTSVADYAMMFDNCTALKTLNTPKTNAIADIALPVTMYNQADNGSVRISKTYTNLPTTTGTSVTLKVGYTITANANSGTIIQNSDDWLIASDKTTAQRVVLWDETSVAFPIATRTGYNLSGWADAATGGNAVTRLDNPTADKTIYAQWNVNKYTLKVTYHTFVGANSTNITVNGTEIALSASTTIQHEYSTTAQTITFLPKDTGKYYKINVGSLVNNRSYSPFDLLANNSNYKTVTYSWTPTENKEIDIYVQQYFVIDTNGYVVNAQGNYYNQDTLNGFAYFTLKLMYPGQIAYTTIYNKTGGTWTVYPYGSEYDITLEAYENYVISLKNSTNPADYSASILKNGTLNAGVGLNVYGCSVYNITFDGNTSTSGSTASMTNVPYMAAVTLTQNGYLKTGYTFAGWNTKADGTGTSYSDKASVTKLHNGDAPTAGETITLYAQWNANSYTVTFNPNGGNVDPTSKQVTYDSAYGTLPTPTKAGYTFAGWYATSALSGSAITASTLFNITTATFDNVATAGTNATIYAKWTAESYVITIAANGGTGGLVSPSTYSISGEDQQFAITLPTYDGYLVDGWEITGNKGGVPTISPDNTTLTIPAGTYGDIVLNVTWKLANVNISMQYVLDNYTVEGITKDGYYGSAKTIAKSPKLKLSGDVTWQNASETTFDNFVGITAFNSAKSYGLITYVYGTNVVLTITVDTEYELKALYINGTSVNLSTIAFTNGTATHDLGSVTADTTILAKFERKKVTIQLELVTQGTGVLSTLVSQGKYSSGVITADGTSIANGTTLTKYYGDSSTFIIMPNAGYVVTSLIKPGESTSVSNPSMTYSIGISYLTSGKLRITLEEQDTWLNHASTETWSTTGKVVITTPEQLALLSKKILLGEAVPSEIVLGADIDLTGHNWFPIGTSGKPFAQIFDGDSYTISNMTVLNGTAIGLFGYNSGTVYNVKVSGSSTGGQIVGGVVGHNSGNVEFVVNGVITKGMSELEETTNAVGGVVGYNTSNIFASYNTASVTGYYYVGGIAGYNSGTIKNAYNTGAIANNSSSSDASVGGIAGYTTNTDIGYVYNIGSISHDNNTPYSHFAGNMTLTLSRWYQGRSTSPFDIGRELSQENLQPISTAEFNSSTYFENWNSASSNGYKDDIWEINPQDNDGYKYPTFTLQKGFVGTVTITSSFDGAEASAVAFVTITSTSGNSWRLILYRGAVYTITKLAENETLTITVSSTINHTATASLNTLTLTSESNTITVTIQKTSTGTFYAGTVLQAPTTQELQIQAEDLTYTQEVEIQPEVEEETVQEETEQAQETQTTDLDDTMANETSQRVTQEKLVYSTETTDLQSSKKTWSVLNLNKKRSFAI